EYITNNTITNDRITTEGERIDGVDKAQDDLIASNDSATNEKIDKVVSDVAEKDAAQDSVIADNKTNIDRLDKEKADITYVDNSITDLGNTFITNMNSSTTTINSTINENTIKQQQVDRVQDNRLDRHDQQISDLGYHMDKMDSSLSGGIASASAIAFMPTPNAGGRMMTG